MRAISLDLVLGGAAVALFVLGPALLFVRRLPGAPILSVTVGYALAAFWWRPLSSGPAQEVLTAVFVVVSVLLALLAFVTIGPGISDLTRAMDWVASLSIVLPAYILYSEITAGDGQQAKLLLEVGALLFLVTLSIAVVLTLLRKRAR